LIKRRKNRDSKRLFNYFVRKEIRKRREKQELDAREYGYASFQRMFQLPESADQDKVQAEMKNGCFRLECEEKNYIENKKQIAIQ
jgi:HSP20 family protein